MQPEAPKKNPGSAPGINADALKELWHFNFDDHAVTPEGRKKIKQIKQACKAMADALINLCPPGRDQALALTQLEQMSFHANAAIARGNIEPPIPEEDQALKKDKQEK